MKMLYVYPFQNNDLIDFLQVLQLMSDQDSDFIAQESVDGLIEQVSSNVGVYCT